MSSGGAIEGAVNALVANGNASVDFTNKGAVIGNMVFGAGDVALHFYTGSSLIGNLTAGTGTNTIDLNGLGSSTFSSPIANFQTVTKLDDGTWTLSGAVSGPTALNVSQGTLILSAANTYTGGTTISGGTLQLGNGGATGSIVGDVTNNGTLAFDRSDEIVFPGVISGGGAVSQIGSGGTILTADSSYTGGTTIASGFLQLGLGGTTGGIVGDVVDNGTLVFDRGDEVTFAGVISGAGGVAQAGSGTTILTGASTYLGGTKIVGGALQLGDGGTTGSIIGDVLDFGALAFDRSDAVTFAGTISGAGSVSQIGSGSTTLTATNTYSGVTVLSGGTLIAGNNSALGTGTLIVTPNLSGTTTLDNTAAAASLANPIQLHLLSNLIVGGSNPLTLTGEISGAGALTKDGASPLILTADDSFTGGATVKAGTLVVGDLAHPSAALSGGGPIAVGSGGALGGYGSVTGPTVNNGVIAAGSATPGFTGSPTGTFTVIGDLLNQGLIQLASGVSIGNVLEVRGAYVGAGGRMAINTFLGGDGSPSDRLVINGDPAATGATSVHVANIGGTGALTTANGILVVNAINGATTAPGAFTLSNGELRAGAFDYRLFRGGVSGSPDDWFLRSSFFPPTPPEPPGPPVPPVPPVPPPSPIIGPELATYGVVQPLARQLGLSILGTLDDRVGATYEPDGCAVAPAPETSSVDLPTRKSVALPTRKPGPAPCPLFSPSAWGRFFGQTIDNHYQAFADPRASGAMGGFQGGVDLLRGSLIAGHYERAGLYGAYGDVNADVDGLVTNPAATAYILARTGSMNLDAWSAGGYWTHVGPSGWYLDAVLQGTWYYGSAGTQFARLNTDGTGFIASLEGGYPFSWPQFGPGFVIEPQGQILWQKVSFRHDYDGLGDVALGDTTGPSGRIGLRTKWTVATAGGQVWQPYLSANLWRDWGAEADAVYSGTDVVPLVNQATMLELGGGLTGRVNANVSVFANVDYEFAVGSGESQKRNGVRGAFGARYTW